MTDPIQNQPSPRAAGGALRRLSFAKDKREVIEALVKGGPFREYRDVLVFAAAVGWHEQNRLELSAKDEPIRWETATNRRGTEALANMIAAMESEDPDILRDDRFDERLEIFEQYANGGLAILKTLIIQPRPAVDVILEFVQKVARSGGTQDPVNLADTAGVFEW